MEYIKQIFDWLKSQSIIVRIIAIILVAGLCLLLTFTSCGSVTRTVITTQGNDSVQVETTVTKKDSTHVNVNVNPTINFQPKNN